MWNSPGRSPNMLIVSSRSYAKTIPQNVLVTRRMESMVSRGTSKFGFLVLFVHQNQKFGLLVFIVHQNQNLGFLFCLFTQASGFACSLKPKFFSPVHQNQVIGLLIVHKNQNCPIEYWTTLRSYHHYCAHWFVYKVGS